MESRAARGPRGPRRAPRVAIRLHALDDVERRRRAEVFEELGAAEDQFAVRLETARRDGLHRPPRGPAVWAGLFPACAVAKATDANVRSRVRMAMGRKP